MSRFTVALLLCLTAAEVARADDEAPELCGDAYTAIQDGALANDEDNAAAAQLLRPVIEQLITRVAKEVHMHEGCSVSDESHLEKACKMKIKKGDTLDRDDTKAAANGILIDIQVVKTIGCPDGSFKVRYEARGIKSADSDELVNVQTRFIDVFDSTFSN